MDDCRVSPKPQADMKIICAGQSEAGMAFTAKFADYSFCFGKGVNTPKAFAPTAERLETAMVGSERDVTAVALFMVIADETDEAARARWQSYKDGVDEEAVAWLGQQGAADTKSKGDTNIRQMADPTSAVNINMGTLVGSYEAVASMLDEIAEVPATSGVMLTFDDFVQGIENFGQKIQPLMKSRKHVTEMLERIE
jgi:pyrimidine oxygenase